IHGAGGRLHEGAVLKQELFVACDISHMKSERPQRAENVHVERFPPALKGERRPVAAHIRPPGPAEGGVYTGRRPHTGCCPVVIYLLTDNQSSMQVTPLGNYRDYLSIVLQLSAGRPLNA